MDNTSITINCNNLLDELVSNICKHFSRSIADVQDKYLVASACTTSAECQLELIEFLKAIKGKNSVSLQKFGV